MLISYFIWLFIIMKENRCFFTANDRNHLLFHNYLIVFESFKSLEDGKFNHALRFYGKLTYSNLCITFCFSRFTTKFLFSEFIHVNQNLLIQIIHQNIAPLIWWWPTYWFSRWMQTDQSKKHSIFTEGTTLCDFQSENS